MGETLPCFFVHRVAGLFDLRPHRSHPAMVGQIVLADGAETHNLRWGLTRNLRGPIELIEKDVELWKESTTSKAAVGMTVVTDPIEVLRAVETKHFSGDGCLEVLV